MKRMGVVQRSKIAILLIGITCLVAGSAYSLESSAKKAVASDGVEYVYVSLNSDTQVYQISPKDRGELNIVSSEYDAGKQGKINTDMSSYQVTPKEEVDDRSPYYRSIREKILARLKRNYTNHYNNGDVSLFFILNKEGDIVRIDVALSRSTKDVKLIDTALLSLQQAAPFGPFPKNLNTKQVLFSLTISFKKDSR